MHLRTKMAVAIVCALITCLTSVLAQPKNPVNLNNYPRYGKSPPPEYRPLLQPIVDDVLRVVKLGGKANVRVVGHADFDAKGRDFENQVSLERATVAQQTLLSMISTQASLVGVSQNSLWQNLRMTVEGIGTKQPVKPNPQSEDDRKLNRRVEIYWTVLAPTPPGRQVPPPSPVDTLSYRVVGFGVWSGAAKVTLVGAQVMRFKVTNTNLLGTTISIENELFREKKMHQIPAMGTVEFEFFNATEKPIQWRFDVSSESDAFAVTWSAMSFAKDQ